MITETIVARMNGSGYSEFADWKEILDGLIQPTTDGRVSVVQRKAIASRLNRLNFSNPNVEAAVELQIKNNHLNQCANLINNIP